MRSRPGVVFGYSLILLFLSRASARAVQNIQLGTLDIHPYLLTEEHYDDNIYLVPRNSPKTAAWVNVVSPGLFLRAPFHPRYEAHLDARAEFLSYSKDAEANNAFHRMAFADVLFNFPRDSSLKLYNNFIRTSDPSNSELVQRPKRNQNDAGFVSQWGVGRRLGMVLDFQHTLHRYLDDSLSAGLDRMEYLGGGGVFYRLFPKTHLSLQYHYTQIDYDFRNNTNNSRTQVVDLNLNGILSPKVTAAISAGGQWRTYPEEIPGAPSQVRTSAYKLNVEWKPSTLTSLQLVGGRSFQESIFASNRYYISDALSLEMKRILATKWTGGVQSGFEWANYPVTSSSGGVTDQRQDHNLRTGLQLAYAVQPWLSLGAHYFYRQRLSNFPVDYRNHGAGLSLKVTL